MTPVAAAPRYTVAAAADIAHACFGVDATATELASERDQNLLLHVDGGPRFVLKIANPFERRSMVEAENAALRHIAATGLCPQVVATVDGEDIATFDDHLVRLVTHLPGTTMAAVGLRSEELLRSVGAATAAVDGSLLTFDHPAVHREFHWDLSRAVEVIDARLALVADPDVRALVERVRDRCADQAPMLRTLRHSVIHNDANDHNLLVGVSRTGTDDAVLGLVDFGDMVWTQTINGLAIAMAYAALGQPDPLRAAARVAAGYHAVLPLTQDELSVLFDLMCSRWCVSICVAAEQTAARPGDEYLAVSQGPILTALPRALTVHPRLAHYVLRDACGLPAVPSSPAVVGWLRSRSGRFAHLVGRDLSVTPVIGLDMGAGSTLVTSDPSQNSTDRFTRRVFERMAEAGTEIGVGGYGEARVIYESEPDRAATVDQRLAERRTVHVGLDVTMASGTPLYAPLAGVVHGFEEVSVRHDYGPVIVLRHEVPADADGADGEVIPFFSLYGHLSRESLDGLHIGRRIEQGEQFAAIGTPPVNGDWWPHVHTQVILDMLDVACNMDGVSIPSRAAVWMSLCPDPNLLLGVPDHVFPRRPSIDELGDERRERIGANLGVSYGRRPLNIVRGWMQHLYDDTGRWYVDAYNNVAHVGHSHPRVVRAVSEQLAVLNTNTRYLQRQLTDYAELLTAQLPDPLRVCFFTASGSEANELALRLARAATGRRDVLVMDSAYHGHTTSLIDISPYKHAGPGGSGAPDWVHTTPIPDAYRAGIDVASAGQYFAASVASVIDACVAARRSPSAYIAETCPSVGGQLILPDGYLAEVYRLVRAAGSLCIADEVQTGFGRIGSHMWAFEQHGVVPDVVVLGKPIANGYPMGAVVTTAEIAAQFDTGMEFFSTFGGTTVACAAAMATLQVVLDDRLQAHAATVGAQLLAGLRELQGRHELIGDVRGAGLFLGVELVRDRATREPAADEASWIVERMRMLGVLAGTDGPFHNVLKLRGPMPLASGDADVILHVLDQALREMPDAARRITPPG